MAITNFIPEIWNAQLRLDFRQATVAVPFANREFEGNATRGNKVKISGAVDVAIKDYKAAGRTTSADAISDTSQELLIDQEKVFDFYVDDIDRAQAAGSLDAYTRSAAAGLATDADKFLLNLLVTGAGTNLNSAGTGTLTDPTGVWNTLRDGRKALNKAGVPAGSRVAFINAEAEAHLLDYSSKIVEIDKTNMPQAVSDAVLGRLLGFTIVTTENLPTVSTPQLVMAYAPAMAYVSQIEETEAMRGQDKFSDRLRGLHVYGGKVTKSAGVVVYTSA